MRREPITMQLRRCLVNMPGSTMSDWVLVPREPTDAMKDAAARHYGYSGYVALWEAMLAAAPSGVRVDDAMVERLCAAWVGDLTAAQSRKWWEYFHGDMDADDLRGVVRSIATTLSGVSANEVSRG